MNAQNPKDFLRSQLLEVERLIGLTGDHPVMQPALLERRRRIVEKMADAKEGAVTRTILFFSGSPVIGSIGIDAHFAATILEPFLGMVKTQYAATKHGKIGARGPRPDESESRLLLTGMPRGSFGLELSMPSPAEDFIVSQGLSQALVHVTEVIKSSGEGDEQLALAFANSTPRLLENLKSFLRVAHDWNAGVRVLTGDIEFALNSDNVALAWERVSGTNSEEKETALHGVFRGVTLESWRFDFKIDGGGILSGRLADTVSEGEASQMVEYINKSCVARMREIKVTTRSGLFRVSYELLSLANPDGPTLMDHLARLTR